MRVAKLLKILLILFLPILLFAQKDVNEIRDVNKDVKIDISNISGSVSIVGWDKSEVKVEGTLEEDVKELEIEGNKSRLKIKVRIPRYRNNNHASAYLVIHVPYQSQLDVSTVSAEIDINGIESREMEVGSVSGSINADVECDIIDLETVSGKINLSGKGKEVESSSVSGSLKVEGDFRKIDCGTVSGRIKVEANNIENGEFGTTSGRIIFNGGVKGNGRFKFKSVSGSIDIALPGDVSAEFDISSFSGSIHNNLSRHQASGKRFGPGSDLQFVTGSGDIRISASSFSGSVEIDKR